MQWNRKIERKNTHEHVNLIDQIHANGNIRIEILTDLNVYHGYRFH